MSGVWNNQIASIFRFNHIWIFIVSSLRTLFRLTTPRGDTRRWLLFPEVFRSRLIDCGRPRKRTKWMLNWIWKFLKWLSFYLFQCCWFKFMFVSWIVSNNSCLYIMLMNPAHKFIVSDSLLSITFTILMTSSVKINTQFVNILENQFLFYTQFTKLS